MDCRTPSRNSKEAPKKKGAKPVDAGAKADPSTGVFTDGSSVPNPGPGGWGAVYVVDGRIIAEASGFDPDTTNNRMELTALIEAASLVPDGVETTIYSDSHLAVNTINEWASEWERRGWKRKSGPVENLDLVKAAYTTYKRRKELDVVWIKAHVGYTWNEYADELANAAREAGA
ncbi:MAG: ribonuclease HI [Acidimicrobiia bacterium]|nr:ribonuclease HI [Acidimicrobiia bacterium]